MNYIKNKVRQLSRLAEKIEGNTLVDGVSVELTNLTIINSSELIVG